MANPWFRMYSEFATDPKVQMLSEVNQRRYVMLLCMRCSNDDVTLHDEEVAFQLRVTNEEWMVTKAALMSKGMIDDYARPCAWDKRQYISDSSTSRVAAYRERKKQQGNVTVTPPDTDTDTDTEDKKPVVKQVIKTDYFDRFWKLYPKKKSKADAEKAWSKLKMSEEFFSSILVSLSTQAASQDWTKSGGQYVPLAATWIRGKRWEDEASPAAQQKHSGFAQADYTAGVNFDERGNVIL
jgi:hypothetical protein